MEAKVYNQKGEVAGMISLPSRVFAAKWNSDLVHQVIEGMRGNKRAGTADTKDRGEVRGGGKKPWRQKGTGRARHGSTRSPIWVGGGVAHGPVKEKNYQRKISKKMRAGALFSVLSKKLKEGEVLFIESLLLPGIKTKQASEVVKNVLRSAGCRMSHRAGGKYILAALSERNKMTEKSFRNLPALELVFLKNLNPLDVLERKYLLIENPKKSVEFLMSRG